MQTSFGATIFQMFDKVIVAVLAILAIFSIAKAVIKVPEPDRAPQLVKADKARISKTQEGSRHKPKELTVDYLSGTVGQLRPDVTGFEPRPYIFYPRQKVLDDSWKQPVDLMLGAIGNIAKRSIPEDWRDAQLSVVDPTIVKFTFSTDKVTGTYQGLKIGSTLVRFAKGALSVEVRVTVKPEPVREPALSAPVAVAAAASKGQVQISWQASTPTNAVLTGYRIFKGEDGQAESLYLKVAVPEPLPDPPVLPTTRPDGEPGPDVTVQGDGFLAPDPEVQGGVTYAYTVQAEGHAKADPKKSVISPKGGPAKVKVVEPFKIKFEPRSTEPPIIAITIEKFVVTTPGKPGVRVAYTFQRVERGQPVGWVVPEIVVRDGGKITRLKNVDLSTGYQVLDILNGQRRAGAEVQVKNANGEVIGVRQPEEKTQKVLIISSRGRIRVLWPGSFGD